MKIIITGADGFVGQNLIKHLPQEIKYVSFVGDISSATDIDTFFSKLDNIDQIIHLAGIRANSDRNLLQKVNVEGTKNILDACVKYKIKKIIFASSGAVYGKPLKNESYEDDFLYPVDQYGNSKKSCEELICHYYQKYGLKYVILRFSNIYGPGGGSVINIFDQKIKRRQPILIQGNGEQKRNFLFINDAISAIIKSIQYHNSGIFNIADKSVYAINDVVIFFQKKYGDIKIIHEADCNSNALQIVSENIEKSKKLLRWEPYINLAQGIQKL